MSPARCFSRTILAFLVISIVGIIKGEDKPLAADKQALSDNPDIKTRDHTTGSNINPCEHVDLTKNVPDACDPCKDDDWLELILNQRSGKTKEVGKKCFNNFPLGTNFPFSEPEPLTKGAFDKVTLDLSKTPRGFTVTTLPFFRYNYPPKAAPVENCHNYECKYECKPEEAIKKTRRKRNSPFTESAGPPGSSGNDEVHRNLDIGSVGRYFKREHVEAEKKDVDFQLLEWPGRSHDEHLVYLTNKLNTECNDINAYTKPKHCQYATEKRNFTRLHFYRESSKFLQYPCNTEEGTQISALGLVSIQNRNEKNARHSPHNAVFLSFNKLNIYKTYTPPLYVTHAILKQMAKPNGEPICQEFELTDTKGCKIKNEKNPFCNRRKDYFVKRGELKINDKACENDTFKDSGTGCGKCAMDTLISDDLPTVLDFTFVRGRLILGMRCGILVINDFIIHRLDIVPASLQTSEGLKKNAFKPVSKIASNACCKETSCRNTIVAAYPAAPNVFFNDNKEIYISYDLGTTFMVKLLAEQVSALNLMWGMYKMYGNWMLYHQILEDPDPEDLKNDRGEEYYPGFIDLRAKPYWESLTLEEKETRFLYGESRNTYTTLKEAKDVLGKYVKARSQGALARFVRYRSEKEKDTDKEKAKEKEKEINLDISPEWLKTEIKDYRTEHHWHPKWTDSNCDSIPQCREKFENDHTVKYFLGDSGVIVKTPKRRPNVPFCDQIVSMAVLEEEDTLYILCVVGFGDFRNSSSEEDAGADEVTARREKRQEQGATGDKNKEAKDPNDPGSPPPPKKPPFCSSRESIEEDPESCIYENSAGEKTSFAYNKCVNPIKYYAIWTLSVKEKLPLVMFDERRSERLFTCRTLEVPVDWVGCKSMPVDPEIIRVPDSITLIVKNCANILYYSPNGGRTMYNAEFYAHNSEFVDRKKLDKCDKKDGDTAPPPPPQEDATTPPNHVRQQMYMIKSLDVPPQIAISPLGNSVFLTMKNKYAFGLLGVNKEFWMVVGDIFNSTKGNILERVKSHDYVFPSFSYGGTPFFGVALNLIYSHNPEISCGLYKNRQGIRLVHKDAFFYNDIAHYYDENVDIIPSVKEKGLGVSVCKTLAFSVRPKLLKLDVGESGKVEVKSYDPRPNIPLAILSSEEKSLLVDVDLLDRDAGAKEHLTHDWDINIHAIRNYKKRIQALVDSFFGIENNNMFGYYTEISLANELDFRCHVQPAATVAVHIECRNKRLVAHEDEHRPQCDKGTFSRQPFSYRIKKGEFDPDLLTYWRDLLAQEGRDLFRVVPETGELEVTYDYIRFGCPLEPYRDEEFIPDLRIVGADDASSSEGKLYEGPFLLIELFGGKGFNFKLKYGTLDCKFLPINITQYIVDWVHRKRMFRIAFYKQNSTTKREDILNAMSLDEIRSLERGNKLFLPNAVDHPINIINRVTYRDCKSWRSFFLKSENKSQFLAEHNKKDSLNKQELPILKRTHDNRVIWNKKGQPIHMFMAIALDPTESLCEYYTIFGVSIPDTDEASVFVVALIFLILVLIWILLFLCGFYWRKSRIREMCIDLERKRRLEEAAWKIVYRYEKLLQEHENYFFEQELNEYKDAENEKAKLKQEKADLEHHKRDGSIRPGDNVPGPGAGVGDKP